MKIKQLSIFLENRPGQLQHACRVLAEQGINIITTTLSDTKQFGILRLIVRDWEKAQKALEENRFAAQVTDVAAIEAPDKPGGLSELLSVIEACELNIEYMYAFPFRHGDKAVLVFRFDDVDEAIARLQDKGVNMSTRMDWLES